MTEDVGGRAAPKKPAVIPDWGQFAHVPLSVEGYHRPVDDNRSLVDRLSVDDDNDLELIRVDVDLQVPEL